MAFPLPKPKKPELPSKVIRILECKQGAVRAVRFNADGNYCLTGGSDKSVKLWNPYKGTFLKTYSGHGYEVLDVTGSFDNSQLCSCSADKTVILWDVASGQVVRKFRGHAGKVNCIQFNEESTVIISGSIDSSIRCWDCRSRKPDAIQVLNEAKDGVSSVKVSDHEILSGSVDGQVRRYDLRMGELFADYVGSPITSVCFSKDGQCTLSSSLDSTLRLLDKETGELLGEYKGHKNKEYKLDCCLNEKDTHVLSCSEDGKVYYWDLVEGSLALSLPVGKSVVQSLSFHPADPCLLTATEGSVHLWREESFEPEEEVTS
ncbi:WD repeat domain-containing protein 83 [Latimeria chalumnae]|uniref:WD repeat domain-containing protein 83 n=1 Tax=Latimeria chalumnae TaxID=7897 RepID=H3ARP2_LATCH|nr:PREDICTED: WD repeat domain-containing protein 83 [Latimeria chalumnae]|eukprot:XP_006003723.1 PREDICTED: WD repeat domain-containing protein 83 [Latimeria chalumnae]